MSQTLTLLVAAFAPSLALLGYFALRVGGGAPPLRLLLGVFAGGILSAPVALLAFELLARHEFYALLAQLDQAPEAEQFVYTLFAIGPLEELAKFSVVLLTVHRFRAIDRPAEGVLYASAAALGFATFENWYAMVVLDDPLWYRALTLPFVHALFSSFWGFGLGFDRRAGRALVLVGLLLSAVYHGIYDYILVSEWLPNWMILPLVLILWLWLLWALSRART